MTLDWQVLAIALAAILLQLVIRVLDPHIIEANCELDRGTAVTLVSANPDLKESKGR